MAEVRVAPGAQNFRPRHSITVVHMAKDILRREGLEETGPAGAGIKFRFTGEERQAATDTIIDS